MFLLVYLFYNMLRGRSTHVDGSIHVLIFFSIELKFSLDS